MANLENKKNSLNKKNFANRENLVARSARNKNFANRENLTIFANAKIGKNLANHEHLVARSARSEKKLQKQWYILHTYSGYEDIAAENLRQRVKSFNMENKIFNVLVPKEKKIKIRNNKRVQIEEKIYPGYVFVEMIIDDESWYFARNTPKVTGIIGADIVPIPVTETEINLIQKSLQQKKTKIKIDIKINDTVKIVDGPLKNFEGKVIKIDFTNEKINVNVNMFDRNTSLELDLLQIKKV